MTEPKRRGRPPKAKPVEPNARVDLTAEALSGIGPEDFDRKPYSAAQAYAERVWSGQSPDVPASAQEAIGAMKAEVINIWAQQRAQAYAERVWNGQSPDVPRPERLRRVALALEGQGLSMEGVKL